MILVVDASVGIKWFVNEDYSDEAEVLLEDFATGKINLVAPSSFKQEFCNAIRKYVVKGQIKLDLARIYIEKMSEIPIEFVDIDWSLLKEAFKLAIDLSITVYDAIYVALSKRLNAKLITADEKLIRQIKEYVDAIHIKDYKTYNHS